MNKLIGLGLIVLGAAFIVGGLYCSFVVMLLGGVVDIANQIKSPNPVEISNIVLPVLRIVFFEMPLVVVWLGVFTFGFGISQLVKD